ncbi:DUF3052 family protein [bacterium]|nr:DUF3052 family protein [bacterium]
MKNLKSAGYSGTPLIKKLGIKEGSMIALINPPKNYTSTLGDLPANVRIFKKIKSGLDFIQFFTQSQDELEIEMPDLKNAIAQNGMIWISWPKGSSKIPTDVNENTVRDIALRNGLVDVKVCAVDEIWSGLKLVIPVKDRR